MGTSCSHEEQQHAVSRFRQLALPIAADRPHRRFGRRKLGNVHTNARQVLDSYGYPGKLHTPCNQCTEWDNVCQQPSPIVSDYAAVSTQNSKFRKHMEDECVAIPKYMAFAGDPAKSSFFGVYDGHGGDFCAKYAASHFHKKLSQFMEMKYSAKHRESDCSNHSTMTSSTSTESSVSDSGDVLNVDEIENCFVDAFATVDKELSEFEESACSGSTAVTCLIRKHHGRTTFHVANVGDSRAIYYANGVTTRLSVDHKATNEDEVKRIRALNGIIFNKRVAGMISVTRALGQADEKQFITSAPHIETVDVGCGTSFLMLVSDGVTDAFCDEEVTQFVSERLGQGEKALSICAQLLDEAKVMGSMDNMTAVLICFSDE